MEKPLTATTMLTVSNALPRVMLAITPIVTPAMIAMHMLRMVSRKVLTYLGQRMSETGTRILTDSPKSPSRDSGDPAHVLHGDRLVQTPLASESFDVLLLGDGARHHPNRVAGNRLKQQEDQNGGNECRQDGVQGALVEVSQHVPTPDRPAVFPRVGARRTGVGRRASPGRDDGHRTPGSDGARNGANPPARDRKPREDRAVPATTRERRESARTGRCIGQADGIPAGSTSLTACSHS